MKSLITLRARARFKSLAIAITAIVVCAAPALSLQGWALLGLGVALLIGTVVVCDALDLFTLYRDFLAWRKERDGEAARIVARRRQHRENLRLLR